MHNLIIIIVRVAATVCHRSYHVEMNTPSVTSTKGDITAVLRTQNVHMDAYSAILIACYWGTEHDSRVTFKCFEPFSRFINLLFYYHYYYVNTSRIIPVADKTAAQEQRYPALRTGY